MAFYSLPDLDYDYKALEPHLSGRILELHHDKHHKAYVDGVNATLEKLAAARASDDLSAIVGLEKTLAFNLSGHVLHTLFWQNLTPGGTGRPSRSTCAQSTRSTSSCRRRRHRCKARAGRAHLGTARRTALHRTDP